MAQVAAGSDRRVGGCIVQEAGGAWAAAVLAELDIGAAAVVLDSLFACAVAGHPEHCKRDACVMDCRGVHYVVQSWWKVLCW